MSDSNRTTIPGANNHNATFKPPHTAEEAIRLADGLLISAGLKGYSDLLKEASEARGSRCLVGMRFGRLFVVSGPHRFKGKTSWKCQCDCGSERMVRRQYLESGQQVSCGCYNKGRMKTDPPHKTHMMSKDPKFRGTYVSWKSMRLRCYYPSQPNYHCYGGRGIKVCDKWLHSFEEFFKDMGLRPDGMTLDRIDVNGNYEPGNCRWATASEQAGNKRKNSVKVC